MAINYMETNTANTCPMRGYCLLVNRTANASTSSTIAAEGAAAGGAATVGLNSAESNTFNMNFEIAPLSTDTWDSGNWTIRINVTTANANLSWVNCKVCRVSSGCVNQAELASLASTTSLGTTGDKTCTPKQAAGASPAAGDIVKVVFAMSNGVHSAQTFGLTRNRNINSPFNHVSVSASTSIAAAMEASFIIRSWK